MLHVKFSLDRLVVDASYIVSGGQSRISVIRDGGIICDMDFARQMPAIRSEPDLIKAAIYACVQYDSAFAEPE